MSVEFDLPQGFQVPQDVEPGKTFDAVATLELSEDGKVTIEALDGVPVGDDDDKKEKPEPKATAPGNSTAPEEASGNSFVNAMG